jgi:hypothetical protein
MTFFIFFRFAGFVNLRFDLLLLSGVLVEWHLAYNYNGLEDKFYCKYG